MTGERRGLVLTRPLQELISRTVVAEMPLAATVGGAIFIGFGLVDSVRAPSEAGWRMAICVVPAIVLFLLAWVTSRGRLRQDLAPTCYAIAVLVTMLSTLGTVMLGRQPVELVYTLLVFASAGAGVLEWTPFAAIAVAGSFGFGEVLSTLRLGDDEFWHWIMAWAVTICAAGYVLATRRRSIAALAAAQQEIETLAITDPLTGLLNRHGFTLAAGQLLAVARRQAVPVFVLFVDVDGLKRVYDGAGHDAGDRLLQAVGREIRGAFRESDVVARWGGDEFVVLGLGNGSEPAALELRLVERLLANHECPREWIPAVSAGLARQSAVDLKPEESLARLVDTADADMYRRRDSRRRAADAT